MGVGAGIAHLIAGARVTVLHGFGDRFISEEDAMLKMFVASGLLFIFIGMAVAQQDHTAGDKTFPTLDLPPKLRAALVAEMGGLREGIADIAVKLASGEWEAVAARATRIRDSFIMKQKLSREELAHLERALPAEFLALDEQFHRHADSLAEAAHRKDGELATFYFYKMTEGCLQCHARYATHTFKGFGKPAPAHAH